jgi:hypothetical protein
MSIACELEIGAYRPRLYALCDHPARFAPPPRVRRRRVVLSVLLAVVVLALLVLLALPLRVLGGSTLAQAPPARDSEYVVKAGDTLASIAAQADPTHAAALTGQLAREAGSAVVVPGEHVFIP